MNRRLSEQLMERAEPEYQKFAAALIPNIQNVLGVRLPVLRKLAKELAAGDDWQTLFADQQPVWFEERMLRGMIIGYMKTDLDSLFRHIADFVPLIDNWSVCDSFCSGLKITLRHKAEVWEFLQPYFDSDKEYELRFAVVMALNYYIDEHYLPEVLVRLDSIRHEAYYVKMAVAWAISMCFVKMPEPTMVYLHTHSLDKETFNKALQKITESNRVDPAVKRKIREMKIK